MSNELNTPKVLVCPNDPATKPAADFASLQPSSVSYQINIAAKGSNAVLIVCPFDGSILRSDGSVESKEPTTDADGRQPMRHR